MIGAIITWIVIGLIAGTIAAKIMNANTDITKAPSWVENAVLGIIGAVIGGLVLGLFGIERNDNDWGFWLGSLVTATLGAILLLVVLQTVTKSRNRRITK